MTKNVKITDISIARVTEFFLEELRNGGRPSVTDYAKAFPHLADQILSELPAIVMLERTLGNGREGPAQKSSEVLIGEELGGCIIEGEIGRGAMGIVYRAKQLGLNRIVAVKVLPFDRANSTKIVERFELERQAMAMLDHPHIVPVYSFGHDERCAFLIMKHIDGCSLLDLQEGRGDYRSRAFFSAYQSDWSALAKLGSDIAAGLQHSHDQGLVHRDVKPGNLLLDKQGKVWITDYGLAKVYDYARSLTGTGDAVGTPRYMAPEQVRGICDPRSDIYSLGITLYELASQERPWLNKSAASLIHRRTSLELANIREKNPQVPESLAKIIMKACAFSPEDRYQSCSELRIVLKRFQSGVTPSDRRKRKRESDEVYRRKTKRNLAIAFAGLITAIVSAPIVFHKIKPHVMNKDLARAEVPRGKLTSTNFLEKLAEGNDEHVGEVISDFFRKSVEEAGEELHFSEQEKSEVLGRWEDVAEKFRRGKVDEKSMKTFADGYRSSTLPLGTKIVSMAKLIERSRLNPNEREQAFQILRSFAKAVIHRSISLDEAKGILGNLTGNANITSEQLNALSIPDEHVRWWLAAVVNRLRTVPPEAMQDLNVKNELERIVQESFGK